MNLKHLLAVLTVLLFIWAAGNPGSSEAATLKGTCLKVLDGDLVAVKVVGRVLKIRLAGIDCPEPGQDYHGEAKEYTTSLALKKRVTLTVDTYESETDLVARVSVGERDLSMELVSAGLAWYREELGSDKKLAKAQKKAKKEKIGLWSRPDPAPPWVYRMVQEKQKTQKQ